jgi:ribosomal protein S18 acetylase RimI-like enzyme
MLVPASGHSEEVMQNRPPKVCRFVAEKLQSGKRAELEATSPERVVVSTGEADDVNAILPINQRNFVGYAVASIVKIGNQDKQIFLVKEVGGSSHCERRYAFEIQPGSKVPSKKLWADDDVSCGTKIGFFVFKNKTYAHTSWEEISAVDESGLSHLCALQTSEEFKGASVQREACSAAVCDNLIERISGRGIDPYCLLDAREVNESLHALPECYDQYDNDITIDVDNDGLFEKVRFVSFGNKMHEHAPQFLHLENGKWAPFDLNGFPASEQFASFVRFGGKTYTISVEQSGELEAKRYKIRVFLVQSGANVEQGSLHIKPKLKVFVAE